MSRLPATALATLVAGSFVGQLGYAIAQPLLPFLLGRAGEGVNGNTGLLTATYAGALVVFSPLWGRLSDSRPRRLILVAGIGGLAAALVVLSFVGSLAALYAGLFLAGAFSGAIWPVALAIVAEAEPDERDRARSFGHIYAAITAGLLTGPAIGGLLGRMWVSGMPVTGLPFLLAAVVAVAVLPFAVLTVPIPEARPALGSGRRPAERSTPRSLVLMSLLASWGLGAFEVGLTLRGVRDFALGPDVIGWMFVECMVVMILVQLLIFSDRVPPSSTRLFLVPSFVLLALALLGIGFASVPAVLYAAVAAAAAALGAIAPVIGYWISLSAGSIQGTELGRQAAAASLGQAIGSATAGLLFGLAWTAVGFVVAASAVAVGALLALPLARRLASLVPEPGHGSAE